ncbi:MAG: nucleoside transporter C-terminal domain-containing protein [Phascolarctobacterium sp.]|nr:nucleoside transporter C-terminal domain-containing protein [Phascolarctobacterium sp.]
MNFILNVLGIAVILGFCYLISYDRKNIKLPIIAKALALQIILAVVLVKIPAGVWAVGKIGDFVTKVVGYARDGLQFVFGCLIDPTAATGFVFVVQVLGTIIFVGALVGVLTYLGILGWVIAKLGRVIGKLTGCSQLEGFISTANIFLSDTESPLLMSRYLGFMTNSEIMVMLVSGMGSMSMSILGGYIAMGIPANYLVIAGALVPFASIAVSKILLPEIEEPQIVENIDLSGQSKASNLIEAIANGAMDGMQMVIAIAASLVAIISMVALVNGALELVNLKLEEIFAWIFSPLGYLMGLDGNYPELVGKLLGCKLILTEFISYDILGKMVSSMDQRTAMMLSIACSGFGNVSAMAICVSGIAALCPPMKGTLSKLVFRGMLGGFAVSVMNAMIVGIVLLF